MDSLTLPPDLERFAAGVVKAGRYRDTAEVVAAGLSLLRQAESERAAFVRSLEEAEAEADRDGWVTIDEVMAEADRIISEMRTKA